jgi:glycosyltransferase involved in cell wall biosynthesis
VVVAALAAAPSRGIGGTEIARAAFAERESMNFSGISVLLPVYLADRSAAGALKRATQSVLNQECSIPLELIVVDDGSPVSFCDCVELRDLLRHPAMRRIRLSANRGLVYALNVALARARYDLIARIDADDFWRSLKLRKQLESFSRDENLTLLGTGMRLVHEDSAKDRNEVRDRSWAGSLQFFAESGCPFPHASILARKEIFMLLGGYPHAARFRHCEDFALWGAWIRFFKCEMLSDVLLEYSVSERQISSRCSAEQRDAASVVQRTFADLGNPRRIPAAIETVASYLGRSHIETGKLLFTAWRYFDHILTDREILDDVRVLLPDRRVLSDADAWESIADRFFEIRRGN